MQSLTRRETPHWRAAMTHRYPSGEVERLLGWMAHLARAPDLSAWERTFTASILGRARSPRFRPSEKQIAVMRRLVDDFQAKTLRGEGQVIED